MSDILSQRSVCSVSVNAISVDNVDRNHVIYPHHKHEHALLILRKPSVFAQAVSREVDH